MTTEEEIKKAEQEVNRAKKKLAEAKRKAQKEKRAEENSRKYMMDGLVAKYLREDMELDFMDFSEEEITRIVACGMKQRDTRNMLPLHLKEPTYMIGENILNHCYNSMKSMSHISSIIKNNGRLEDCHENFMKESIFQNLHIMTSTGIN